MFISITFTETSIDETNKTQQKVRGSKFMFKMSTIHANTCIQTTTPLCNHCHDDGVVQQPPLPQTQQTYFQLLHIMDPRTIDPVLMLQSTGFKSGELDSHTFGEINSCRLSLKHGDSVTCTVNGMISVTSILRHQVRDVHGTQRSKFTSMISIHLQSCVPKILKIRAYYKSYCEKISVCGHGVYTVFRKKPLIFSCITLRKSNQFEFKFQIKQLIK